MRIKLAFISLLVVLFFAGCKKEEENTDPFTNGTICSEVYNYNIKVKNDSVIVAYHFFEDSTQAEADVTIEYIGDSLVLKTVEQWIPAENYHYTNWEKYYLNSNGTADSVIITSNNPNSISIHNIYHYYPDGYLKSVLWAGENDSLYFQYIDGNYIATGAYEYYDYNSKLDLFSIERGFDNGITGKDDKNLPKHINYTEFDDNHDVKYYYKFDTAGYITAVIIVYNTNGSVAYTRINFNYEFIQ